MNDKSNSGKTILEVLAFLAILVLLTFGGIHIFFSIYNTTIAKNLTEDVIRRTVAKQHATLAIHSQKQVTSIVNAIGPHNIPVSEEDGVDDPYKDFFWITLGNVDYKVNARICAKLLEKQESLKQLKLVGVFINNRAIKNCPEEGAEVKYFFSKKDDLTSVPVIKIAECEDEILCPPHAICADAQISCMPGYNKAARGTCDEHCVPCGLRQLCPGGVEPTNPTECPIGQKPSSECICCETSDSAELCGCSKPNGECDCNCESNEDCPSNYVCDPDDNLCVPHCTDNPCNDDEICDDETGLCNPDCTINGCNPGYDCNNETKKCEPRPCVTSNDCDGGYTCNPDDNICIPHCLNTPCGDDEICNEETGLCNPGCTPTSCKTGYICDPETKNCIPKPCVKSEDCDGGYVCNPNGNMCIPHCLNNPCGDDDICNEGTGLCDPGCTLTGCEAGYICNLETKECEPKPCETSNDCDDGYVCNPDDNICIPHCLYSSCDNDEICNEETGFCDPGCTITGCEAGYICNLETKKCEQKPCETSEDCDGGYVCSPDDNICIPHCLNNPCGDDDICNEGTGLCDPGCTITSCGTGYICDLETKKCTPKPCATSNDCEDGYICNPNDNTCIPDCLIHNECDDGQICDATTKLCIPNCPEGNRILVNEHYICADCGEHAAYNMENNVCKCETGYSGADFVLGAINTCCLSDKAAINNGQQTCCADDEEPSGAENAQICCPIGKMNIEGICVSSDCAAQWCIVATSMLGGTECSSSDSQFKKCTVNGSSLTCTSSISLKNGIADLSLCDVTIAKGTSLTLDGVQSKVKSLTLASATATVKNSSTLKITDDLVQETDTYRTMTISDNSSVTVGGDTYANLTKPSSTNYWQLNITDSTFSTNEITVSTESTSSDRSLRLDASNSQIKATDIEGRVKITLKSNSSFEASSLYTSLNITATDSTMKIKGDLVINHLSNAETYTINQSEFKNSELTVDGYMYSLGAYKHEIGSSTIKGDLIVKNLDLTNTSLTADNIELSDAMADFESSEVTALSLTAAYPITASSSSYGHIYVTESSVINIGEKITVDNGQLKLTKSELNAGEISMHNENNANIWLDLYQNSKVNVTGPITGNMTIGSHDSALDALSVDVARGISGDNSTINIAGDVVFDDKWTPGKMQGVGFSLSNSTVEVMGSVNSHLPYKQTGGATTIHGYLNPRVISIYKGSLWADSINIQHPENNKPLYGYICASGPSDCTETANTGIYIWGGNSPVTVAGNLHSYEEVYVGATASLSVGGEFTLVPKPDAQNCFFVIRNAYDSSLYNFIGGKCNFTCSTTKINIATNVVATNLYAHNASNITIGGDVLLSDKLSVGYTNNDVPSSLFVGGNVNTKDSSTFSSASVVVQGDVSASDSFEVEGDATFLTNNINTTNLYARTCGEICAKDITVYDEFSYASACNDKTRCSVVDAHSISVGREFRYYCHSPNERVNPWPNAPNMVSLTCSVNEVPCVQKLDCPY